MYALRVPEKDCEARFFGKRNGNGANLPSPLSVWHKAQVCRDDVSRDRLLLSYSFAAIKRAAGIVRDLFESAKVG